VVSPPDSVCYTVAVPNDRKHIGAFFGALYNLTSARFWQDDPAHTALDVAAVWQAIYDNLVPADCDATCPPFIDESDYDMSLCEQLRFQNGQLQALCCGVWTNISGQPSQGIGGGGQPGSGSPQPAPNGGCQSYQGSLDANGQWVCPYPVSTGDTIQITALNGAWTDGSGNWYCPQGDVFFAGLCTVPSGVNGADPLPASPHMGLITKIAGAYHFIGDSAIFTVPGGVSNKLLILQANSAALANNYGTVTFAVNVCNNQVGTFSHRFDFTTGTHGWTLFTGDSQFPAGMGSWSPGVGWKPTMVVRNATTEHRNALYIKAPGGSVTPTLVTVEYAFTGGQVVLANDKVLELQSNASGISSLAPVSNTAFAIQTFAAPGALNVPVLYFVCARANGADPSPTGDETAIAITISGNGADPYAAY